MDDEQQQIDTRRREMVDEMFAALEISDVEHALQIAKNWCETAAQQTANAEFLATERDKLRDVLFYVATNIRSELMRDSDRMYQRHWESVLAHIEEALR